jgi:hypothetical protein
VREGARFGEVREIAEELQGAGFERRREPGEEQPAIEPR